MRKKNFICTLLLSIFCISVLTSCVSKSSDESNETYETRKNLIMYKWETARVQLADGTWNDFPMTVGRYCKINFHDRTDGKADNESKFEITQQISTDAKETAEKKYHGIYTVDGKYVEALVDGKPHFRLNIKEFNGGTLTGTITFVNDNLTFEVEMHTTF